jgi:polysaccharide deacetylase family protein (PEP-CTERM system associated)
MVAAFTIDVEEWFHPIRFYRPTVDFGPTRLAPVLDRLVEMLDDANTRATFYWVGELARSYGPQLRALASGGHEIGCHSFRHDRFLYNMGPLHFREDTRRAKEELEDAAGAPVVSYRAPCFSITSQSLWAFEILEDLGFETDSSVFPVYNWRYGMVNFSRRPIHVGERLVECPLPVVSIAGVALPASGGAYFRLYPYAWSRAFLRAAEHSVGSAVFYIHPWELDALQPKIRFHPLAYFTHYINLARTQDRLLLLLRDFRFSTVRELSRSVRGKTGGSNS